MILSMHFKRAFWLDTDNNNELCCCPVLKDGTIQDWNFDYARNLHSLNRTSYDLKCLLDIQFDLVKNYTGQLYKVEISKVFNDSLVPLHK